MHFGNVSRLIGLLYKKDFLLPEVLENSFSVMTARQVGPEGIIIAVVIAGYVGNEMVANVLTKKSLPTDKRNQTLDEQMTQTFRIYRNPNEDLIFDYFFGANLLTVCLMEISDV